MLTSMKDIYALKRSSMKAYPKLQFHFATPASVSIRVSWRVQVRCEYAISPIESHLLAF